MKGVAADPDRDGTTLVNKRGSSVLLGGLFQHPKGTLGNKRSLLVVRRRDGAGRFRTPEGCEGCACTQAELPRYLTLEAGQFDIKETGGRCFQNEIACACPCVAPPLSPVPCRRASSLPLPPNLPNCV
ncbi:MAG: hypothetical protein LBK25_06645 [Treponema sp.]|jgi:hypothetical protein|nr:hypothetical protein [Treponema sp.]